MKELIVTIALLIGLSCTASAEVWKWVDENGNSTYLLDDELAQTLEGFRPLVNSWEAAAESAGVVRDDIILSWPVQTQSVTSVLKHVRSTVKPTPTVVGPAGMNTSAVGGMGIADIYAGIIDLPYSLGVPSAKNPSPPLTDFWTAAPGAYVAPFDERLPDTTSTHVTFYNPFPVLTDMQTVPLLMTVPNENSGHSKPAAGWPVLIFGHGLTGNRSHALAVADTAAAAGYAVIAIDFPLHGITPDDTALARLYVPNTPFAPIANERTFDLDLVNNETGAPGPDEKVDPSGTHIINLQSMLTTRDNFRQGQADLFFNSGLIYEMAVLKLWAEPRLAAVEADDPHYGLARTLIELLSLLLPVAALAQEEPASDTWPSADELRLVAMAPEGMTLLNANGAVSDQSLGYQYTIQTTTRSGRWTWSWSTRSPHSRRARKSKARWATPTSVCRPA